MLQGSQLAALTQARAAGQAGGQPKVLTIQLQVQQQPNQQGGVKVREKSFRVWKHLLNHIVFVLQNAFSFQSCFSSSLVFDKLLISDVLFCDKVLCSLKKSCKLPIILYCCENYQY